MTDDQRLAAENFAKVAREYCTWVEGELGEPKAAAARLRELLAKLQYEILKVPYPDMDDCFDSDKEHPAELKFECAEHFKLMGKFNEALDVNKNIYLNVDDPLKYDFYSDSKPEVPPADWGFLDDDLADIYGDLKQGLHYFDNGFIADAMWEWGFNFEAHWGRHLMGAQSALHQYLANEGWFSTNEQMKRLEALINSKSQSKPD